jgi:phosphoribosyl-ATP pyrophosphohydrolase
MTSSNDTLAHLAEVITTRRQASPDKSYVARLFSKGTDAILKKIGEEATEVVMACKDADRERIVGEMADLWFHSMLALSQSRDAERDAERGAEDGAERDAKREAEQVANPQGESK